MLTLKLFSSSLPILMALDGILKLFGYVQF